MKILFICIQYLIPHHLLSRLTAALAECPWPFVKTPLISVFVKAFNVNLQEASRSSPAEFSSFNDFFTRELKQGARTICATANSIASPVDGSISELGDLKGDRLIQAKNMDYSLDLLLGHSSSLTSTFTNGSFATLYLSPKDYHRIHAPVTSSLIESFYIPGKLFSVNPTTAESVSNLFARNERLVSVFDTEAGKMALIMVGAMIVAGIRTSWHQELYPPGKVSRDSLETPLAFKKGDELGMFQLGSTVILLFEPQSVCWHEGLSAQRGIKLGESLATITSSGKSTI
jgi:phosphatidylserine decarboxylase